MFIKGSAKYGRRNFAKIADDVGKPLNAVETYAATFWDANMGKKRFLEQEYDWVAKLIERGEKKIEEIKGLEQATRVFPSIFDNPWKKLEFTYVNCKDKMFTMDEDRSLLCWSFKVRIWVGFVAVLSAVTGKPDSLRFPNFVSLDTASGRP